MRVATYLSDASLDIDIRVRGLVLRALVCSNMNKDLLKRGGVREV